MEGLIFGILRYIFDTLYLLISREPSERQKSAGGYL